MRKIISLFQRNYDGDRLVRDEIVPGAEWVIAGEGTPTVKWDGTACMVRDGELWARYDAKQGKTPPPGFQPAMDPDPITGHWAGWVKVENQPAYRWHREAFRWAMRTDGFAWRANFEDALHIPEPLDDGTYELCGPHFNDNPENVRYDVFIPHGKAVIGDYTKPLPEILSFDTIREWFNWINIEGVVWHHPDGRMVKIKKKDFGLIWPIR